MNGRGGAGFAWASIALLVLGCSGEPLRGATPVVSGDAKRPTPNVQAAPIQFTLASEGLPMEGYWKSVPAIADVNGDGFLDIAVNPRLEKGPRVFLGNGRGVWRDSSRGLAMRRSCGGGLQFGDVNKDGTLDLVVADHCEGVYVFLGDGKGNWRAVTEGLTSEFSTSAKAKARDEEGFKGAEAVGVGDVNGDGFLDMVVSSSDQGGLTVYLGDGTGKNWTEVKRSGLPSGDDADPGDVYLGGWAFDLRLLDMNGDRCLDVVASYYTGPRVWRGDCKGHFVDHSMGLVKSTLGGIYGRIAVGDINGDGRPDIAIANNVNGAEAYLQNADGTWQGPIDMMPELKGGAHAIALADLDGDGNIDVVIGGALSPEPNYEWDPHGLFVRWGDGKGGYSERRATNLPSVGQEVIWGIKLVDMNGDGRPDILVTTGGATGKVSIRSGLPMGANKVTQKSLPIPHVQVWINDGTGGR
jgi:hypothetical protein